MRLFSVPNLKLYISFGTPYLILAQPENERPSINASPCHTLNSLAGVLVGLRRDTVRAVFPTGGVLDRVLARRRPGTGALEVKGIVPTIDAEESHFAPVLAPAVPDIPEFLTCRLIDSPPNDGDNVVSMIVISGISGREYSALILVQGACIDITSDGPTGVNFSQEVILS